MSTENQDTGGQTPSATGQEQTADTAGTAPTGDAQQQQTQTGTEGAATAADPNKEPGDGQQDGQKAGEKKPEEKPAGAPEQYEEFTAPEGIQLDVEISGELKTLAKELNLSQADAQRVADLGPKLLQKWEGAQKEMIATTIKQWEADTRSDKEIGGDKLTENLAAAKKARDTFASPELVKLLNDSGMGNHPEVVRFFVKIGKGISEDNQLFTGRAANAPASAAQKLYPNQK